MRSSPFFNLIQEINSKIGQVEAASYKYDYKEVIDSNRTFSEISNVKELLDILLDRDVFWESNIEVLENIVRRVSVTNQNERESLLKTISMYKKLQTCANSSQCDICKVPIGLTLPLIHNLTFTEASAPEPEDLDEEQEFDMIFIYLSERLAFDWRRLATSLGLEQGVLDTFQMEGTPPSVYIEKMLRTWKKQNGDAATKEMLISKLSSRRVLRLDLVDGIIKGKYK